ncbi:MAG: cation-translocating P-type ATPase [Acidimicrobiales bacterium]
MTLDFTPTTDPRVGLTDDEVTASRASHGANAFTPLPTKSVWDFFSEAFQDPMLKILLVCAAASLALGFVTEEWIDGVAIAIAVLIVTGVGTYNQLRAQRDYTALDAAASKERVRVIRSGHVRDIDAEELVVGEVMEINTGDIVPADALYVRGGDILVNEAHITGEPDTTKFVGDQLFGSSRVLDGSGRAVVTGVGDTTVFGKVRMEIGERSKETPLEERLNDLAGKIGKGGTWAAIVTFVALIGSGLLRNEVDIALDAEFAEFVLEALTIAITIVVVAVPEGLPLAVTLSLAYTTQRMAKDNALVRELSACETMGAATVVCSDKTGTLTTGAMTLHSAELHGRPLPTGDLDPAGAGAGDGGLNRDAIAALADGIALNSTAEMVEREGAQVVAGSSTEGALLRWLIANGVDYRTIREEATTVLRRDFNSSRKHMLTVIERGDGWHSHMKGAPEVVLAHSSHVMTDEGMVPNTDQRTAAMLEAVRAQARRGHRTLGFASQLFPAGTPQDGLDQGLVFTSLFVIADPIRPEVTDAVDRCRRAGVRVMIITGDIHETAQEIGKQAGIVTEGSLVLEGRQFRELSDEDVSARLSSIAVLSRALPEDKKRMVELLQAQGDVVAVTGDGVNDAPALVTADVGFSMGSGSKVAREASDIVIVDDNFASLVGAIRWGRSVFENIRKFLQFQLTVNVVALSTAFVAAVAGYGTPLTAVQLLWVNLIMDSLAALALALEPPTDALFDQPPHGRTEPLISRTMWTNVLTMGAYMLVVLLVILLTDVLVSDTTVGGDEDIYRNTFLFNAFVWMQIFNELNCRSVRFYRSPLAGLFKSFSFLGVAAMIVVLQIVLVEFGGEVFTTVALSGEDWLRCILIGLSVLGVSYLVRAVGRTTDLGHPPVRSG